VSSAPSAHVGRYFCPEEALDRAALAAHQRCKLAALLAEILPTNRFYRHKLAGLTFDPERDLADQLSFTTRAELERDQRENPPYGSNLTYPLERYVRLHQTSGSTSGRPMRWLDTTETWDWWKKCWGTIFAAAGITRADRIFFPFSFGPFVGFWGAFDSAVALGNLCLPAGGMTTPARLKFMLDNACTVVCCTPTYALRMAEVAQEQGVDLPGSPVRALVVAGEPGGSIPATRQRIEAAWGARVFDHTGMTEIGPIGFECLEAPGGVHLNETECIAEVIDPETGKPVGDGEPGELILTNLGRFGSPVLRYRTRDRVRVTRGRCACGRWLARMEGGILGRYDDMITVRGNNFFPATLEDVIRRFTAVAEYRVEVDDGNALAEISVEVEPAPGADGPDLAKAVARAMGETFPFRAAVKAVPSGALPRFEMKAARVVRKKA